MKKVRRLQRKHNAGQSWEGIRAGGGGQDEEHGKRRRCPKTGKPKLSVLTITIDTKGAAQEVRSDSE